MEMFGIQDFVDNRKITSGLLGGIEISYTPSTLVQYLTYYQHPQLCLELR